MEGPFPQIAKAASEAVYHVLQGTNKITIFAPPQAGKTGAITTTHERLIEIYPNALGLYVSSFNHKEFVVQILRRIEHLANDEFNLYYLRLRDKKQGIINNIPLKDYTNDPIFVYYDESHFGDGVNQVMHNWLVTNGLLPNKIVFLFSVSATCFSSFNLPGSALVTFDSNLMKDYNSITNMINNGDVFNSEWLVKKRNHNMQFNFQNPAFKKIEQLVANKETGFVIIRLPNINYVNHAKSIFEKLGKRVLVRLWNMGNPIDGGVKDYFQSCPKGWLKIIIVQQKARMGNSIPTDLIKLVYEYLPKTDVANSAQSLAGRCCGFDGKKDHHVQIYSQLTQLKAYSLFEQKRYDDFYQYCLDHNLKVSNRSKIKEEFCEIDNGSFTVSKNSSKMEVQTEIIRQLKQKGHSYFLNLPEVRPLSAQDINKDDYRFCMSCISSGINPNATRKIKKEYGHIASTRDDVTDPIQDTIYYGYRTNKMAYQNKLMPTEKSIHYHM